MRLRREPQPSPETVRALAALDAALAGEDVAPEHADLRELALAVRAERPRPRPEFELALDLRAHEGFAPEGRTGIHTAEPARRRELHTPHRLRVTPLALGTAASLFIVATAVLTTGLLGGGAGEDGARTAQPEPLLSPSAPVESRAQDKAAGATGEAAPAVSPPVPGPPQGGIAPGARRRQVERSAELVLSAPRDQIEDVADGLIRVIDRHRGFVLSSSVSAGESADAGASFDLRIPSDRLQEAVADLSELAHVRSRTQAARDVTAEFSSPRRRLADALAERRGLLRRLSKADTANETAAVRARLRAVNRRIDRVQAQLRGLRERVAFAAVSVSIRPGAARGDGGGWSLGDAGRDALSVLAAAAGGAIIALAVTLPAGIVALLVWLAYRVIVRRRREQALDGAPAPAPGD